MNLLKKKIICVSRSKVLTLATLVSVSLNVVAVSAAEVAEGSLQIRLHSEANAQKAIESPQSRCVYTSHTTHIDSRLE